MAGMCGGMMTGMGRGSRLVVVLFGLILLGLAAGIVLEPQVLAWLVSVLIGLAGLAIILMALWARRALRDGASTP